MLENKQKKNILFYCPFISRGGIETTLIKYSNFLCKYYQVSIFTNSNSNIILSKLHKKIKVYNIRNKIFLKSRLLNNFAVYKKLLDHKRNNSIIFSLQDHFFILLLNFFFTRLKIIIRTSSIIPNKKNKDETRHLKNVFLKKLFMKSYRLADKVITFSNENVKFFISKNIKSVCIYNFFQKQLYQPIVNRKKLNIFFIGRFSFEKDPIFFLQNLLKFNNINIHLVGDGIQKTKLTNLSKDKKNIFFHGFVDNPLNRFKKKIDLLCITSKYEGTPNIMGEAMAYGIPVLAPKNVGLTKLFLKNGKYGFLYKNSDNNSFKNKVFEIINFYTSAKSKAKKGYFSMNRFNENKTLHKVLKEIKKL
jgi:glycosyltransferase involved in cell wall biosynthesis